MSTSFQIVSCQPGDGPFKEVFRKIHPAVQDLKEIEPRKIENDYMEECLVLVLAGSPLGRIALYRNPGLMHDGRPTVQLGHFECVDDSAAAKALFAAALEKARKMGAAYAIGPLNGSTWNEYRYATASDGSPAFFTEHTHPTYYPTLWQHAGFAPFQEYMSNRAPVLAEAPDPRFFPIHRLTIRSIQADSFAQELELLYPLCLAAFAHNPLYTPITQEKFVAKLIGLKPFLSTGFTRIVIDEAAQPVAFLLFLPDLLDPLGKTLIGKTAAKHPSCAIPGLAIELYKTIIADAAAWGYKHVIHAFMHKDNRSLKGSRNLEGVTFRQYTLYSRPC